MFLRGINLQVRTKILAIFIVIFLLATLWIIWTTVQHVEEGRARSAQELMQTNAYMSIAVTDTVRVFFEMTMELVAERIHLAMAGGTDIGQELKSIFSHMNLEYGELAVNENIFVYDSELNLIAMADEEGGRIEILDFFASRDEMMETRAYPVLLSQGSGHVHVVGVRQIDVGGELAGFAVLLGNTAPLKYFLDDFMYMYDSFVSIADGNGLIFVSTRAEDYLGLNLDDLGFEEAGGLPYNTIVRHVSPVTNIEKLIYALYDERHGWTALSAFDAAAVSYSWVEVMVSSAPAVLAIFLAVATSYAMIVVSISPLNKVAADAKAVARGNLHVKLNVEKNDEFGQVANSLLSIVNALNIMRNNFRNAEEAVAHGDYGFRFANIKLGGVFDEMFDSTSNIIRLLHVSMKDAQRTSKAKSDFLATMSHEIRTPLNAILGITQIELQKPGLGADTAGAFSRINSSGRTLLGIINDILDISRIESGKFELVLSEYSMVNLLNETVQLNITRIGNKDITFEIRVDKNIPQVLHGDDLRLKQVLSNLLSNAIKYTNAGTVRLSVSAAKDREASLLTFVVSDTGQGLSDADMKNLFKPYTRFNVNENRSVEGAGLGLTITQKLISLMGGKIAVHSELKKGTKFTVTLRQKTVNAEPIGEELAAKISALEYVQGSDTYRMTYEPMPYGSVLVVDDVEVNLHVAEGLLAPYQLKIETASSGFEVLDKISAGMAYDVILMDHMMPKMDGIETTEKLRDMGYSGSIIALTANALIGSEEKFKSSGFDGYISKPVDIRQLDSALRRFVRDTNPQLHKSQEGAVLYQPVKEKGMRPKLAEALKRDITKAVAAITDALEDGDIDGFIISAHAMKSAMANMEQMEVSAACAELEAAAQSGDFDLVYAKAPGLVAMLKEQLERLGAGAEAVAPRAGK